MEQHKVLMIIISVSLFVALVIGVALFLFYPRSEEGVRAAAAQQAEEQDEFDAIEYLRRPDTEAPEFTPQAEETTDGDVIIVYGEKEAPAGEAEGEAGPDGEPEERDAAAAKEADEAKRDRDREEPEAPVAGKAAEAAGERAAEPSEPAPEPPQRTAARPGPGVSERGEEPAHAARRDAATRRERKEPVTRYWIQVISSPNLGLVRDAQTVLEDNSLAGRITTTSVDGKNYFRLRIGPYGNKDEAGKFLTWVKRIEGFGDSYISETYFRM